MTRRSKAGCLQKKCCFITKLITANVQSNRIQVTEWRVHLIKLLTVFRIAAVAIAPGNCTRTHTGI